MCNMKKWALVMFAVLTIVAIACEAEASDTSDSAGDTPAAVSGTDSDGAGSSSATASGGLDEACVQQVLGRQVTGFADITAAERDAVFEQCSGTEQDQRARQFANGGGGNLLTNLDEACVTRVTGSDELDLGQLSIEQRQELITECAPEGFDAGRTRPGGGGFGRFPGGEGFADINDLLQGCVTDALGETPDDLFALTSEQLESVRTACADELPDGFGTTGGFQRGGTGDGLPEGGRFFGGDGGVLRGAGGFPTLDFGSECVTTTLGREVTSPQDLSREEFQQIFSTCF
jgi:hypothetical protein